MFVSVAAELSENLARVCWTLVRMCDAITPLQWELRNSHRRVDAGVIFGSCRVNRLSFVDENRTFSMHVIGLLLRAGIKRYH